MPSVYPSELKARLIGRMLGPEGLTLSELARETGVGLATLCRWRARARSVGAMTMKKPMSQGAPGPRRPQDWSPEERLRAVLETSTLAEDALGGWLRREGLHAATLVQWREAALRGLGAPQPGRSSPGDAKRVKELERELRRKEKALAEAAALLVLQGKMQALWEEEGGNTTER